jgi:hypothetical protein
VTTLFLRCRSRSEDINLSWVSGGLVACLLLLLLILSVGCRSPRGVGRRDTAAARQVKKVVVAGFRPALTADDAPRMVRSPLSGAVFAAEPVPNAVVDRLTDILFDRLAAGKTYELVTPDQTRGALSNLVSIDRILSEIEIYKGVGRLFAADAVLIGHVYRWQERVGTAYGVRDAASVAFDLNLINPADGRLLWKGRFDKTQRSLSEDLFDMETFVRSRGTWLTAEELSVLGLDDFLEELPRGDKGVES